MGSLFGALTSAAGALQAFQRAVDVTQNNVSNASNPDYAKQIPLMDSLAFQPNRGMLGGVEERTVDSRNAYADYSVQQQLSLLGQFQQLKTSIAPLEAVFDVSRNSAIPNALNQLFQSFSAWSAQPADATSRDAVIEAARQTATAFQLAATQLNSIRGSVDQNLQSTVAQINEDAAKIRDYNLAVARGDASDAGLQAQLHSTLEDLSGLANIQVIGGIGGTITVLLGGQVQLVIGDQVHALQVQSDIANATTSPPNVKIVDSNGADITGRISTGSVYGLLQVRNNLIPSLAGGGTQTGDLNILAQGLADSVNSLLAQGSITSAPPYQPGIPLFTYNSGAPWGVAGSLAVNPNITASQLAATDPGPPQVLNGIALQLAGLDSATGGQINGLNFTQFFSTLVSRVGNASKTADQNASAQAQLVARAKTLRQQLSGVSLDEEAVRLVELQRSYQAASKVVSVIDELTQTLLDMLH
jgi:flagellar hook-associated protein 1